MQDIITKWRDITIIKCNMTWISYLRHDNKATWGHSARSHLFTSWLYHDDIYEEMHSFSFGQVIIKSFDFQFMFEFDWPNLMVGFYESHLINISYLSWFSLCNYQHDHAQIDMLNILSQVRGLSIICSLICKSSPLSIMIVILKKS